MNILSWIIGLPIAVAVVLFSLSNREDVTIGFWPWEGGILVPAYLLVLLPLLVGFLAGMALGGLRALRHRRAARREARRAVALERELAAVKSNHGTEAVRPVAPSLPEAP